MTDTHGSIQLSLQEFAANDQIELASKDQIDHLFETYMNSNVADFQDLKDVNHLMRALKVGLDAHNQEDLQKRRDKYSQIEDLPEKQISILNFICDALEDIMLRILIVVAVFSMLLGIIEKGWMLGSIEGLSILVSVVIVVSVQSYTDYQKSKQFAVMRKIQQISEHETKRNGHISLLDVKQWVVGDIIAITPGCVPKADGMLISCDIPILADESSLTGEAEPNAKEVSSCIIEGCPILDGYGEMIILRLGKDSTNSKVRYLLERQEDEEQTPLQEKLETMANSIGVLAFSAASLTFCILIGFQIYTNYQEDSCFYCFDFLQDVIRHMMVGFGIVIMAIPEGLPLSVTIALAYSVHRMYLENNLVKKLKSCETMGGVSDICTDKTGTLTYGSILVKKILLNFNAMSADAFVQNESVNKHLLFKIIENTSKAIVDFDEAGKEVKRGNQTEIGLIKWMIEQSYSRAVLNLPVMSMATYYLILKLKEYPFTSKTKCSGTIVNDNGIHWLYVKGEPDSILASCSTLYLNDEVTELDNEKKEKISKSIEEHSCMAFRGLVFAAKQVPDDYLHMKGVGQEHLANLLEAKDLTFVAACFLQDGIRNEVPKAVQILRKAGVTTRMITGDAYSTAKAIAIESGIICPGEEHTITTGYEIAKIPESELNLKADSFKVVARCNPEQKLKFVKALKSQGKVVAVTGDGTNDAPCFQVSDVSFTMGKNGTEIVKEAGDIILLDDNYASIVTACSWGRNIQEGIRKFLVFQLTVNCVGVLISLLGSVSMRESPLTSAQMLWVNLIMDTFASLALATDHPTPNLLARQPYARNENLINGFMKRNIVFQCLYQMLVLSFVLLFADDIFGVPEFKHLDTDEYNTVATTHRTIFFHIFILLQLFNEFNCRDLRRDILNPFTNLFRNKYFTIIMVFTFIVQYSLVEFSGASFKCAPISFTEHLFCFVFGFGSIGVGIIIRLIPEQFYDKFEFFRDPSQHSVKEETVVISTTDSIEITIKEEEQSDYLRILKQNKEN